MNNTVRCCPGQAPLVHSGLLLFAVRCRAQQWGRALSNLPSYQTFSLLSIEAVVFVACSVRLLRLAPLYCSLLVDGAMNSVCIVCGCWSPRGMRRGAALAPHVYVVTWVPTLFR